MYLESVNSAAVGDYDDGANLDEASERREVFDTWRNWGPTTLAHHGRQCCEMAREWVGALDYSLLNGSPITTGPRWIRERFKWGPCSHPIHWCEAVEKKVLDCGALAALAFEAFSMRGLSVLRAQFVQQYSTLATSQWSCSWTDGETLPWASGDLIYHEGCAIIPRADEIKLWDASAGWWISPPSGRGYGSLLAVRLSGNIAFDSVQWKNQELAIGEWHLLLSERS